MTIPTPEQLADVLPRVAAGIDGGNWTKDNARIEWARRVLKYVVEAQRGCPDSALCAPESDEQGTRGTSVPPNSEEDVRASIEWLRSLRRSPWPPPAKGTHESDLGLYEFELPGEPTYGGRGGFEEWLIARAWSRTPDHPPAPGITYHGRDDER